VCHSPKFLVAGICNLPDVINCQFREFAAALLGPMHFLLSDQQSADSEQFRWDLEDVSVHIQSVSALQVLRNHALQIDIYLLT